MNVYIIHPEWLTTIGAIQKGAEYNIQINFATPGFRLTPKKGDGVTWTVQPDRLLVESDKCDGLEWNAVQTVIKQLPWTPLNAIGANFHYKVMAAANEGTATDESMPRKAFPCGYNVKLDGRHWSLSRSDALAICNVHLNRDSDSCSILVNYHTDLSDLPAPKRQLNAVNDSLSNFKRQREESELLATACYEVQTS